jgi:4-amino-4-deoxy-L-arabinose transferase-like glycosyltransferase
VKKFLTEKIIFRERPWMWNVTLIVMLLAAFGLRMLNLTNPPLDFASTRQLFSALKARGMYYQAATEKPEEERQQAIALGDVGVVEPLVLETIVSQTYRLTGEHLWIARIYSSAFWVLGGLAIFMLIREFASRHAALIGTLFYLFLPFGVVASRAFMPDPLMVALGAFSLWVLLRWQNTASWKWAILFGLFAGAALFVKSLSIFIVAGGFAGVVLGARGLKRSIRDPQAWLMAIMMVLPAGIYMLYGTLMGTAAQFALRFFPKMWIDPAFYFRWAWTVNLTIGWGVALLAAFSVFLGEPKRERPLLVGVWIGYLLFGMIFPYHFYTHEYYQLILVPVVAISIAVAFSVLFERFFSHKPGILPRLAVLGVVLVGLAVEGYAGGKQVLNSDYSSEPAFWAEIGDVLGHGEGVVGLTQDYGYRLAYWGWQSSTAWFTSGDINLRYLAGQDVDVLDKFTQDTAGMRYFVVTMFSELENQPVIRDLLNSHYPIYAQTDEYIIYDLQHPILQP